MTTSYNLIKKFFNENKLNISSLEDLQQFETKFIDRNNRIESAKKFSAAFKVDESIFYSVVVCINDLIACTKIKTKSFKETRINNKEVKIYFNKSTVYLVIDDMFPLFFTFKEKVLGNVSLTPDGKIWHTYISNDKKEYIDALDHNSRLNFIDKILEKI